MSECCFGESPVQALGQRRYRRSGKTYRQSSTRNFRGDHDYHTIQQVGTYKGLNREGKRSISWTSFCARHWYYRQARERWGSSQSTLHDHQDPKETTMLAMSLYNCFSLSGSFLQHTSEAICRQWDGGLYMVQRDLEHLIYVHPRKLPVMQDTNMCANNLCSCSKPIWYHSRI